MTRRTTILVLLVSAVGLVASGSAVTFFVMSRNTPSQKPQAQTQSPPPVPQSPQPISSPVKIFFSHHPESDNDPTQVFPVEPTSSDAAVATYVISQLLAGPRMQDAAKGYFSTIRVRNDDSNCGDRDFRIVIKDEVATLWFCRTFDSLGVVSDGQAHEVIKASLVQFSTIKKVIILNKDGNCLFDASGQNHCLQ